MLVMTDARRKALTMMVQRCEKVHDDEPTLHEVFMEEMITGAQLAALARGAEQDTEADFWAEMTDVLTERGLSAVCDLIKGAE
jgi:hypothetical protein